MQNIKYKIENTNMGWAGIGHSHKEIKLLFVQIIKMILINKIKNSDK